MDTLLQLGMRRQEVADLTVILESELKVVLSSIGDVPHPFPGKGCRMM